MMIDAEELKKRIKTCEEQWNENNTVPHYLVATTFLRIGFIIEDVEGEQGMKNSKIATKRMIAIHRNKRKRQKRSHLANTGSRGMRAAATI